MSVKVKDVEFITSFADIERYIEFSETEKRVEICVVGRSNVGKSSFINMLAGRKIAKTSSTPGRTRLINLFSFKICDEKETLDIILADLPGYGYAVAGKKEQQKWGEIIESYLKSSNRLAHVLSLVDSRHEPSALDKVMIKFLYHYGLCFSVIATKSDKLSRAEQNKNMSVISNAISIGRDNIIPVSAEKNINKNIVIERLFNIAKSVLENAENESEE